MEKNEKLLKPEESLKIINDMISSAKANFSDDSFYFLFWGWLVAIANIGEFVITNFTNYPKPYLIWLFVFPGIIVSTIYGYRKSKKEKIVSYIDKIHTWVWISFIISYFIILFFGSKLNYNIPQLVFILIASATFLSGLIIKFKPLILGGILFWFGSILLFIVPEFYVPLLSSAFVIIGFLIPGYMLKSYVKKNA
ncbi:hypothetical protein ACFLS4_04215 [Bacteroidota bacterium]